MPDARCLDGPVRSVLNDGTPVLMRPIKPSDGSCLRDGMRRLSPESIRLRFLGPVNRLSDTQLRYLTEIDYCDHMAWLAFDVGGPTPLGIGVARYIRLADAPDMAEMAITVVDSHQGRGVGSQLFSTLAISAARNGIRTLTAEVLRENTAAVEMLKSLGAVFRSAKGPVAQVELTIDAAHLAGAASIASAPSQTRPAADDAGDAGVAQQESYRGRFQEKRL